ncbi:hypothetical protein [Isoptericola nanjingensis]|uniref:hypothetical protein n=1 Tax=Isoptericola nanjingensis TaxID=903413 RepID=UPI003D221572
MATRRSPRRAPAERDDVAREPEEREPEERDVEERDVEERVLEERAADERAAEPPAPEDRPDDVAPPRAEPPREPPWAAPFALARPAAPFGVLFATFFGAPWAPPDVVLRVPPPDRPVPAEPDRPAPERAPEPREVPPPRRPSSARATGHPSVSIRAAAPPYDARPHLRRSRAASPSTRRVVRLTAGYTPPWV